VEDDEEYEPGVRCIAAPIYDYRNRAIAAVSTSGPTHIIRKREVERFAAYVKEAAAGISGRMGHGTSDGSAAPVSGRRTAVQVRPRAARSGGRDERTPDRRRRHADPS
jgi:hypothetical protein